MKMRVFALTSAAALALSACSSENDDTVTNAELNQPAADLNGLADDAANDAANAESAALGNQLDQLNQEDTTTDNTASPSDDQEQNVSGM